MNLLVFVGYLIINITFAVENLKTTRVMENKQSGKLTTTTILGVLLAVLIGYTVYSTITNNKIKTELELEKSEIKSDLDKMIAQYDQKLAEATALETELTTARETVVSYRDSLISEKKTSYRLIKKYKNRIYVLKAKNKELFAQVEVLTKANEKLTTEVASAHATIEVQAAANTALTSANQVLSDKVAIGAILKVDNLNAVALKKLSSGALKKTSRYKKTAAFKVSFKINENALTQKGDKSVHVVITDSEGAVIAPKEDVNIAGTVLTYSDNTTVDYQGSDTEVIVISNIDKGLLTKKGTYNIAVLLDGKAVGSTSIQLKESFLGIL